MYQRVSFTVVMMVLLMIMMMVPQGVGSRARCIHIYFMNQHFANGALS